jgi:hypothetical protein
VQHAAVICILQSTAVVASSILLHGKAIAANCKAARRLHSTLQRISMPLTISATIARELWQCALRLHCSATTATTCSQAHLPLLHISSSCTNCYDICWRNPDRVVYTLAAVPPEPTRLTMGWGTGSLAGKCAAGEDIFKAGRVDVADYSTGDWSVYTKVTKQYILTHRVSVHLRWLCKRVTLTDQCCSVPAL